PISRPVLEKQRGPLDCLNILWHSPIYFQRQVPIIYRLPPRLAGYYFSPGYPPRYVLHDKVPYSQSPATSPRLHGWVSIQNSSLPQRVASFVRACPVNLTCIVQARSEEHTSELQSRENL